jgi:hypothetical protein
MSKRSIALLTTFILLTFSILLQYFLLELFPFTGLARIVTVPLTIVITLFLIYLFYITYLRDLVNFYLIFPLSIILILFIHITLYPQEENKITLIDHIEGYYFAYSTYDDIEEKALYYPIKLDNWHHNKKIFATYIAALYKYQNKLPLDGNYSIYLRHLRKNIIYVYEQDFFIRNKKDIFNKLDSKAEKTFYEILSYTKSPK